MSETLVTVTINGVEVKVPKGTLLVEAAKLADIEIPVFCYHPKLDPAGVCRMCLVEVEGQRKPVTACTTPVTDGMVVKTQTPLVQQLQRGVLEFLLLNHPLDCPICDKGGECPLQDNTFKFGPATSRSLDRKVRKEKAVNFGNYIVFDQERCILCRRCTRFDNEITLENHLVVAERAHEAVVTTADGKPYNSYFSGNTIELCPVGALTSDLYRFKARPWDLARVPSVCTGCSVGCNVRLDFRFGELVRIVSRDNPDIDGGWLCDRGRFTYRYVHSEERITRPLLRKNGEFVPVSWDEALAEIGLRLRTIRRDCGGAAIGAIGGGKLTNEEAYLFQKLVRTAFGSPNVDWRAGEQLIASSAEFPGKIADISRASGVLLVDMLPAERAPVADLRIRRAAARGKATLAAAGPVMPEYPVACRKFPALLEDLPALLEGDEIFELFKGTGRLVALWSGRGAAVGKALAKLLRRLKATGSEVHLLIPGEQANAWGAEAMGVHPSRLPGYRAVGDAAARGEVERAWQCELPAGEGLPTGEMLRKAAAGELKALYLAGANPLSTFPDRSLAAEALEKVPFLVVQELFMTEAARMADIVLPVAAFPEKEGHFTAFDGTAQPLFHAAARPGEALSDGEIFAAVAQSLGVKLFSTEQELAWEIEHLTGWKKGGPVPAAPSEMLEALPPVERRAARAAQALVLVPVDRLFAGMGVSLFDEGARRSRPAAEAALSPEDAARLGVVDGEAVLLRGAGGELRLTARIRRGVMPGTVQVPQGLAEAPVNLLGAGASVSLLKLVAEEVG